MAAEGQQKIGDPVTIHGVGEFRVCDIGQCACGAGLTLIRRGAAQDEEVAALHHGTSCEWFVGASPDDVQHAITLSQS